MRTVRAAPTEAVSMRNDVLREPPGIITVAGTLTTSVLSLDSEIMTPPAGAFDGMVTLPCGCVWPATSCGVTVRQLPAGCGAGGGGGGVPRVSEGNGGDNPPPHCAGTSLSPPIARNENRRCVRMSPL